MSVKAYSHHFKNILQELRKAQRIINTGEINYYSNKAELKNQTLELGNLIDKALELTTTSNALLLHDYYINAISLQNMSERRKTTPRQIFRDIEHAINELASKQYQSDTKTGKLYRQTKITD